MKEKMIQVACRGPGFDQWRKALPGGAPAEARLMLMVIEEMDEDAQFTLEHLCDLCAQMEIDCGGVEEAIQMIHDRRAQGKRVLDHIGRVEVEIVDD